MNCPHSRLLLRNLSRAVLLVACTMSMTGCMTSPHHQEVIGSTNSDFNASGFGLVPNEKLTVQYLDQVNGQWQVMAVAQTGSFPIPFDGASWYGWTAKDLLIPPSGWFDLGTGRMGARVRAVDINGQPMATFESNVSEAFTSSATVGQFWNQAGHGFDVIIEAYP